MNGNVKNVDVENIGTANVGDADCQVDVDDVYNDDYVVEIGF